MVEGHSIWQFQEGDKENYPKAVRVPINPRREIADRAFYAAPMLRHVEIAEGIQHVGFAAWQGCQQLQIVKLPSSVLSLEDESFSRLLCPSRGGGPRLCSVQSKSVLRSAALLAESVLAKWQMTAMFWRQAHSWADMLSRAASRLHPSPLQWTKPTRQERCQKGAFCGSGLETLCLSSDFHNIGPRACENCKRLVEVNLMSADITALLKSTFAHCVAMTQIWLPPRLTQIGKEAFLSCIALQEVVIPTELQEIGIRAFSWVRAVKMFLFSLTWGRMTNTYKQNTMLFCCVTILNNRYGWNCYPLKDRIRMRLMRSFIRNFPDL